MGVAVQSPSHCQEDNDWVKKCMKYEVERARPRGRPKKTWREIVENTVKHVD